MELFLKIIFTILMTVSAGMMVFTQKIAVDARKECRIRKCDIIFTHVICVIFYVVYFVVIFWLFKI